MSRKYQVLSFEILTLVVLTSVHEGQTNSVINWWQIPDGFGDIAELQSSIRVPDGSDPISTYWQANGWHGEGSLGGGYMGMQRISSSERRFLFAVWDNGKGSKIDTLKKGVAVTDENFGNEGTGSHSFVNANWKTGETVFFRVRAKVSKSSATYTGWWQKETSRNWNLIASYRAKGVTNWLIAPYGFLEEFIASQELREGYFGNFTIKSTSGKVAKVTRMKFDNTCETSTSCSIWEQKYVKRNEIYMRIAGKKDEGIYSPNNTPIQV